MRNVRLLCLVWLLPLLVGAGEKKAETRPQPSKVVVYKNVERKGKEYALQLHIFHPPGHDTKTQAPCIVLFHGGGWSGGAPSMCFKECHAYSLRGVVAIAAEYSIRTVHEGTPFDSVTDGKSAIRWVRSHARELGVDPAMIAAGGGSAGGHVAAAAALLTEFDDKKDDLMVSCKPNALVLVSPVFDNGPGGYRHDRVKVRWREFSPLHNIRKGAPPALVCLGDREPNYLTVKAAKDFQKKMQKVGSRCDLLVLEGMEHGKRTPEHDRQIKNEINQFMMSLGYWKE